MDNYDFYSVHLSSTFTVTEMNAWGLKRIKVD